MIAVSCEDVRVSGEEYVGNSASGPGQQIHQMDANQSPSKLMQLNGKRDENSTTLEGEKKNHSTCVFVRYSNVVVWLCTRGCSMRTD